MRGEEERGSVRAQTLAQVRRKGRERQWWGWGGDREVVWLIVWGSLVWLWTVDWSNRWNMLERYRRWLL